MSKTHKNLISSNLLSEIKDALESVDYGSIEIFIQNKVVTQITVRNIHKRSVDIDADDRRVPVTAHTNAKIKSTNMQNSIHKKEFRQS